MDRIARFSFFVAIQMLDLNVCKSGRCKNLGVPNAKEYEYNIRPLGFLAMRCGVCSATPPMLDNESYGLMRNHWQQQVALLSGKRCPDCGSHSIKRFGQSSNGKQRLQCKACQKTFSMRTPVMKGQQQLVEQIKNALFCGEEGESLIRLAAEKGVHFDRACEQLKRQAQESMWRGEPSKFMASTVFTLPYKGKGNQLWGIITTDIESGRVLHISTSLVPMVLPESGQYQPCADAPPLVVEISDSAIDLAQKQEQRFLLRQQFDRCDFGVASLGSNKHSHALPVLTAHAHFAVLNMLNHGDDGGAHLLSHEVFLRGACITQFSNQVKNQQMSLAYVVGETDGNIRLSNVRKLGWWQNHWQEFRDSSGASKAFSVLCGNMDLAPEAISLITAKQAVSFIEQNMSKLNLAQFTASRVDSFAAVLAARYNHELPVVEPNGLRMESDAQHIGVCL
ncbi:transposase [Enterovibrio qingdaonensis]|uniref:transposase n=1 Tax=Enterovibrio qingdaonensis TaxID=2899818 RepID=UPI003B676005